MPYEYCSDYFYKKLFSVALRFGMPPDEFWHGDPRLIIAYKDAFVKRERDRNIDTDTLAWLTGMYTMKGFGIVISNAFGKRRSSEKYPQEPLTVVELRKKELAKEGRDLQLEQEFAGFMALATAMNQKLSKKPKAV